MDPTMLGPRDRAGFMDAPVMEPLKQRHIEGNERGVVTWRECQ